MSVPTQEVTAAPPGNPFPYGWRYVERTAPDGSVTVEQVPLTLEDVLHPQEGDQVTHSDLHQRICVYLYNVLRGLLAGVPGAVVLHDVRIAWDDPDLKAHGPDLAVIFGVRARKNWSTFDVAAEGVRPTVIIEVTSPETRGIDLTVKLDEYDLAGVEFYIIVDVAQRRGQETLRLLGYRRTPTVYAVLPPDDQGRLWIEPLRIWLGVQDQQVVCYDAAGNPIGDYPDLQAALATAEQRIAALEAELRRLRGDQG
ncbi:MAG: Uma2 family endonuclease [Roseiflexus sp.]|nr:Uma2 family endonuclease [Roseiflexus sp.]